MKFSEEMQGLINLSLCDVLSSVYMTIDTSCKSYPEMDMNPVEGVIKETIRIDLEKIIGQYYEACLGYLTIEHVVYPADTPEDIKHVYNQCRTNIKNFLRTSSVVTITKLLQICGVKIREINQIVYVIDNECKSLAKKSQKTVSEEKVEVAEEETRL